MHLHLRLTNAAVSLKNKLLKFSGCPGIAFLIPMKTLVAIGLSNSAQPQQAWHE